MNLSLLDSRAALAALVLGISGCTHADPFADGKQETNGPFTTVAPRRLTFNLGNDQWPIWLPDGDRILYAAQDSLAHDHDYCLVSMPGPGGTYTPLICPSSIQNNVTEVPQQPTVLDGVLAYALADLGTFPPEHVQYRFNLWTRNLAGGEPQRVMHFPYNAPSGKAHDGPIDLRWVRPGLLAYIGFEAGCCNKDTLRFGEQIVLLQLSGDTGIRTFLPNTYRASNLGVASDGLSIYYTFYGDHRVYQQVLATGAVTVLHDFGAGHIVRAPDIVGTRLVATIDGLPGFRDLPPFDSAAVDLGGLLVSVDLTSGVETLIPGGEVVYKRPRLSPSADRLVTEAYRLTLTNIIGAGGSLIGVDTVASRSADLWTFEE